MKQLPPNYHHNIFSILFATVQPEPSHWTYWKWQNLYLHEFLNTIIIKLPLSIDNSFFQPQNLTKHTTCIYTKTHYYKHYEHVQLHNYHHQPSKCCCLNRTSLVVSSTRKKNLKRKCTKSPNYKVKKNSYQCSPIMFLLSSLEFVIQLYWWETCSC